MTSPWSRRPRRTYEDLILKEEFQERRLQLKVGENWMRILPAHSGSSNPHWLLPVHALSFQEGKFAHPKTLKANAKSVFDHAYSWLLKHRPQMLFSKQHPTGVRLLCDPIALFWVAVDEGDGPVLRLLQASGYDGSRAGVPGLGYQIWKLACAHPTSPGKYAPDAGDANEGVQICIEKVQGEGAKFPSYRLHRGQMPAPIDQILKLLPTEELAALCPIEKTVRELSQEEQWKRLATILPSEIVEEICLAID